MILIADGGSTKVDWCLIDKGILVKRIFSKGANPFFRTKEDISEEIRHVLIPDVQPQTLRLFCLRKFLHPPLA